MKVLVTTPHLSRPGGVATYLAVLKSRFSESVDYLAVGGRGGNEPLYHLIYSLFGDYYTFYKTLKRNGHDVVHLNPSLGHTALLRDSIFLLIAKALDKKVVVFIHGWDLNCERILTKYCQRCFRFVYFRADAFIVLAKEFRDKLMSLGYEKRIFIETTVVDDADFQDAKVRLERGKVSEAVEARFNILVLTRIDKGKGVYESIEAYRKLKVAFPGVGLTIAGDGSELEILKQYSKNQRIPDIEFLGYVTGDAKREAFRKADVYLFPTYGEGMPSTVLEAMACGLPVITRPVGGIKDFFENGRMGFVTESRDPKVFAELLEILVLDDALRLQIGDFNRNYARENFAATKVVTRLEYIYRKVLGDSEPRHSA